MTDLGRRAFLGTAAAAGAGALLSWALAPRSRVERADPDPRVVAEIPGEIVGQRFAWGHHLRDPAKAPWVGRAPRDVKRVRTAIVGSGVAGLSAAWAFDRAGWSDYVVLEMEPRIGGTSSWNRYPASECPWGAHYLPLPTPESRAVRRLLRDLGVISGFRWDGTPEYDEVYLCQAPQERLFINARWQEGLWPASGATAADNAQLDAFHADMERWRTRTGRDGRPGFTIPIAFASTDPVFTALDRMSMADYMRQHGFTSPRLRWYVEYATRDDYGCKLEQTSAWAGIHYFTSRTERPRSGTPRRLDGDEVLTWPAGNGWLTQRLRDRTGSGRMRTDAMVFNVEADSGGARVDWFDGQDVHRLTCDSVVLAVPRFVAARICKAYGAAAGASLAAFTYVPWVVSNVVVDRTPTNNGPLGYPVSWDNVIYDSDSLGYVVATHQSLATVEGPSVLTHYQPLSGLPPKEAREFALQQPWSAWRDNVLRDLAVPHPGIESTVQRLDAMVWGHAMVRPTPGFMWGEARAAAGAGLERLALAHTDLSGIAIFEEAQYHGVRAAQHQMTASRHPYEDLLL